MAHLNGLSLDGDTNMVDSSYVPGVPENEKEDVTLIDLTSDTDPKPKPRADDFEAMKTIVFTPLFEQPRTLAETINTWEIKGWRNLPRRIQGPIFEAGGFPWRVLMFPVGNNVDQASFYLEHGFPESKPPDDFVCCVQFALVLWNPKKPDLWHHHIATHRFTADEADWGFTRFIELRKLFSANWEGSGHPLLENEDANMTAYVRVVEDETGVLWHTFHNYDSKKETNYVGLKNQGATCYLNSLIQSLYFTNAFRKAVYQIPTQDEDTLKNSAYTLQRLFYQLQESQSAVSTNELTKSFGWETKHIFEQQDVQELSRKLMERMEEKMKGTEAENVLPELFCGKVRTYISCINVEYVSARVEDFWDIQLNVQGTANMEQSLADYIKTEIMDGENKYFAGDEFKLQDAEKGVIFESFPEVLNLQLKRFEYNIEADAMTKVNTRYEYPETFDASPYLSKEADKSEPYIYKLHSVLVHHGDLNAGHYYAFIRPEMDGWFYKYDDDRVTKASMREVLEDNFGGPQLNQAGEPHLDSKNKPVLRQSSAYMLVYIRESRAARVLLPVTANDTPPHLQERLEEEAAVREARHKEQQEMHLYMNVQVITNNTFRNFSGTDLAVWDSDPEKDPAAPRAYRLLRKTTLKQLAEKIGTDTKRDPKRLRFWCMVNRQNKTCRPDVPLTDFDATIETTQAKVVGNKPPELRVWAEEAEEVDSDGNPIWPNNPGLPNGGASRWEMIVLFLKQFDIEKQTLVGVGHIYINREKKVEDLVPAIQKKMGWPDDIPLKLFEEIKPAMIDAMKAKQSLKAAELQDGDIVCFQIAPGGKHPNHELAISTESTNSLVSSDTAHETIPSINNLSSNETTVAPNSPPQRIEDVVAFYDYLMHRKIVSFFNFPKQPENPKFELELSIKNSYDQIAEKVSNQIGVPSTHLKFFTVNHAGLPKAPVKRAHNQNLYNILNPAYYSSSNSNQKPDSIMYQVLELSLAELETKRLIRVTWLSEGITKEDTFEVYVAKTGTVADLIDAFIKKSQLEDEETGGRIRVYENNQNKIHRILPHNHQMAHITDYVSIVAERIPKDDLEIHEAGSEDTSGHFINAFHFDKEPSKSHGIPFTFLIKENEKFSETKKRLEIRTGLKGKNFEKIKLAVVKRSAYSKPAYLTDDDVLWDVASSGDDLLGLDHVDRTRAVRNGTQDLFLK